MNRYLAIDYGTVRLGLAMTDPLKIIAQPFKVLANDSQMLVELGKVIQEYQIARIILGNPITMGGHESFAAAKVKVFKEQLEKAFALPVILIDERLTTAEAQKRMVEADLSRKKRKKNIDQTAAALILESYLKTNAK